MTRKLAASAGPVGQTVKFSRRAVLQAGGGFTLAVLLIGKTTRAWAKVTPRPQPGDAAAAAADGNPAFAPHAFLRLDPTGPVRLVMPNAEMGQGIYTAEAALLAEELDLGLDQIAVEHSPPSNELYATELLGEQATGGSTSIRSNGQPLREAGAVARAMLVGAAAQKWGVDPTSCTVERGVVHHTASNRSASYGELATAAAKQPVPDKVTLKDPKDFKLIGRPMRRVDSAQKVDGTTQFGIDVRVSDMMVATVVTCPTIGGKLVAVNDQAARAIAGVRDVVKLDNSVAVIGAHFWAAKQGIDALDITWDHGQNTDFSSENLAISMSETSKNGKALVAREVGNIAQTGKVIEAIYQLPLLAHAPMEPLNAVVHVRPDACEIWTGTQVPARVAAVASTITGLPAGKIIVHNQYLGGGFGRRLETDAVEQAIKIAKQVSYPVKLVWTREQDIQHDIPRPAYYDHITATVDSNGLPIAWTDRVTGDSVERRWIPAALRADGFDSDTTEGAAEPPYDLPNLKVEWAPYQLPQGLPVGWWRGVGPTHNLFKVESFVDELAHAAGQDPVTYRRTLLQKNPRALGVLNLAAAKFGWGAAGTGERIGRGIAVAAPFGSYICAIVETEVTTQGEIRLRRGVAAIDCGMVINPNTVEAQIQGGLIFGWTGALYSQLTYKAGIPQQRNFNDYRIMRINETPPVDVHIVESSEASGGIGEVGTAIAAPALTNAIFDATGIRIRQLPIDRGLLIKDGVSTGTVLSWQGPGDLAVGGVSLAAGAAIHYRKRRKPGTGSAIETDSAELPRDNRQ